MNGFRTDFHREHRHLLEFYAVYSSTLESRHGEAADHAADAIAAGKPDVLTINRPSASANRAQSTGGIKKVPGKRLDEYPPAMFKEGGQGQAFARLNLDTICLRVHAFAMLVGTCRMEPAFEFLWETDLDCRRL